MNLEFNTCYSRVLYFMSQGEDYSNSVYNITCSRPLLEYEGVAGYIEVDVAVSIKDLVTFSKTWESWFSISDIEKQKWYMLAKGGSRG